MIESICEYCYSTPFGGIRCDREALYLVTDLCRPGVTRSSCAKHLSYIIEELRAEKSGGEYMPLLVRRINPDEKWWSSREYEEAK